MQSDVCLETERNFDHKQLLCDLKKAVEFWFLNRRDTAKNCTDDGDSFFHVLLAIKNILLDGLRRNNSIEVLDVSAELIKQLNWLQPSIHSDSANCCFPTLQPKDCLIFWIYNNFHKSTLCARLQLLVADLELLTSFYTDRAFLCNDRYATALFICLSALELNQSSLTSQIDTSLLTPYASFLPKHKRSNSHPHFSISPKKSPDSSLIAEECSTDHGSIDFNYISESNKKQSLLPQRLRKWRSLPNVQTSPISMRTRSKTLSQPNSINYGQVSNTNCFTVPFIDDYRIPNEAHPLMSDNPCPSRSFQLRDNLPIDLVKCDDIKIYFDQGGSQNQEYSPDERPAMIEYDSPPKSLAPINLLSCISSNFFPFAESFTKDASTSASSSLSNQNDFLSAFLPQEGKKLRRSNYTMFEDVPETRDIIFGQQHATRQSLMSFFQPVQFTHNNTDLERENAHFSLSEAMIGVIEKMKCSKKEVGSQSLHDLHNMEPESTLNKERRTSSASLLIRKSLQSKGKGSVGMSTPPLSELEDSLEDSDRLTDGSLDDHIEEHFHKSIRPCAQWDSVNISNNLSAERVALSLMSKFDNYQLALASETKWLVSGKDAPQSLVPLPNSPSVDPDKNQAHSFMRGTRDWAPPRQQIIFTDHPYPNRKQMLEQQNYRCTGCGMRVSRAYMNRFRYCTYLGKFHCTGCHRNQMSIIPAKVLEKWDFNYYPVSVFAYRLLDQIWTYPLFYVPDLNHSLYSRIRNLSISRGKRFQLKYMQDFITTCRFANEEKSVFDKIATYVTMEPDQWSMFDLMAVKDGSYPNSIGNLISKGEQHVVSCELCTARGFICELCPRKQIIFPWQSKVKRCAGCGTCFHQKCWESITECAKCQRLKSRKQH